MTHCVQSSLVVVIVVIFTAGCDEKPPKLGVPNWKPQVTGGPIEIRPLPPARELEADYKQWLKSNTAAKVRLYEAVLQGPKNQQDFTVKTGKGETPGGATYFTSVIFIYRDPTNGQYQLERDFRGRYSADFLKLDANPKKVWLKPINVIEGSRIPRLQIKAFEGVEAWQMLVAEPVHQSE